jgi:hypothetical protein
VTDWAGPSARLKKVSIRLGVPNYPGDTMVLSGDVLAWDPTSGECQVSVKGKNGLGYHVTGTVDLAFPQE